MTQKDNGFVPTKIFSDNYNIGVTNIPLCNPVFDYQAEINGDNARILYGSGTKNIPYFVRDIGGELIEFTNLIDVVVKCHQNGIDKIYFAHSGRYLEKRGSFWYETSDTVQCDRFYGLPKSGRLLKDFRFLK